MGTTNCGFSTKNDIFPPLYFFLLFIDYISSLFQSITLKLNTGNVKRKKNTISDQVKLTHIREQRIDRRVILFVRRSSVDRCKGFRQRFPLDGRRKI